MLYSLWGTKFTDGRSIRIGWEKERFWFEEADARKILKVYTT